MEQRLYGLIMRPAMALTWIFGLYLAWQGFSFLGGWLHVKIAAVVALSGVHEYYGRAIREFAADQRKRSARHWRFINEVPTLLMILIVIMVIVKPF
ncbi:Copper resistance protein D [compost metagenome]